MHQVLTKCFDLKEKNLKFLLGGFHKPFILYLQALSPLDLTIALLTNVRQAPAGLHQEERAQPPDQDGETKTQPPPRLLLPTPQVFRVWSLQSPFQCK